jgi:hypothetical protein
MLNDRAGVYCWDTSLPEPLLDTVSMTSPVSTVCSA